MTNKIKSYVENKLLIVYYYCNYLYRSVNIFEDFYIILSEISRIII